MTQQKQKKILLIGCGEYACEAHLPVLKQYESLVEVAAVLVGQGNEDDTKKSFLESYLPIPSIENAPLNITQTIEKLKVILSEHQLLQAAIVSTIPAFNYEIVKCCLESDLDVLVEKPATCPPDCSWDANQAAKIYPQLRDLVKIAKGNNKRLLIGAQRRYEAIYCKARKLFSEDPPQTIQVLHTRGWGKDDVELFDGHWRQCPEFSGGKIMNSGYHAIDIVTWWLSHTLPEIKSARVFCSFDRFTYKQFIANNSNHNNEKTAAIQVQFFTDNTIRPACIASFVMTLGGPFYSTRETYFIITSQQKRLSIERDRAQLSQVVPTMTLQRDGEDKLQDVDVPDAKAGNQEPTRDLIEGFFIPRAEISTGIDHLRSAQIVQAAYLSAIQDTVEVVNF